MKIPIIIAIIIALSFSGCSHRKTRMKHRTKAPTVGYTQATQAQLSQFKKTMQKVALSTQNDPSYNRMTLDTPAKKAWFQNLMYRLWDRQITKSDFLYEGLKKYPTHQYEFLFVANGFQKYS